MFTLVLLRHGESLWNLEDRFTGWTDKVLISAHGNSLRALVKYLDNMSDDEVEDLNIHTGLPLVYQLDNDLTVIRHDYLGDASEIKKAEESVSKQAAGRVVKEKALNQGEIEG